MIPCLDEAETIGSCVDAAASFLASENIQGEVLVIDNGSRDGSPRVAEERGARVVAEARRGYGSALAAGIESAHGRYVVIGDGDGTYDFRALAPFLTRLREGAQLVMGNRYRGGIEPGAMPVLHRYIGTPLLSFIGRTFFGSPCGDVNCGLRGFDREAIRSLDLRTTGMEYASEMVVKAALHGLRFAEAPVVLRRSGRSRPPHLRTWRDGWRHLRFLLVYSPRWLFAIPGVALIACGAGLGAWLIPQAREFGGLNLDVRALLYAAIAVIVGFQALSFWLFTKVFAIGEGLLPDDPTLGRAFRYVTLEVGLALGGFLLLVGAIGSINVSSTAGSGDSMRATIAWGMTFVLGCQVILSSFFMSILGLRTRRRAAPGAAGGAPDR